MIVEELYQTNTIRTFNGNWPMSSVGGCQKALLNYARPSAPTSLTAYAITAEEGHLHEADIVSRLQQVGYPVKWTGKDQKLVTMVTDETVWPLEGHPDGLVEMMGLWNLLEVKSKDGEHWRRFKKHGPVQVSFKREYAQVQSYLMSPEVLAEGVNACLYIAKNRSSGKLYEEIIRADNRWYHDFLMTHFVPVIDAYNNNDPLDALPCSSDEYTREWCPLRYYCSGAAPKDVPTVSAPDLSEAIAKEHRAREMKAEAETLSEEARTAIKNFLIKNGLKKAVVDGVPITIYPASKSWVNLDDMKELVPDEVLKPYIKSSSWEGLRVG